MKIAYGTYAMPTVALEEALPALARIGYEGIEICIGPKHVGSLPDQMSAARRAGLRRGFQTLGLGVPALFLAGRSIHAPDPARHRETLEEVRACAALARDLGVQAPVLALGIGGRSGEWEAIREGLVERLADYAAVADEEGVRIAAEAHHGAAVDRSERAAWLFDQADHPRVGLHFDIVHFYLAGEEIAEAVRAMLPYTVHTHITDARRHADGSFDLLPLGDGELDATAYVKAMADGGWDDFITLEVSVRVWGRPDYDPFDVARSSYRSLGRAFDVAGVPRA